MRFEDLIRERGFSRYRLSKVSGVPWSTLADIYSGKTSISRCNASTLMKIAKALDVSMEEMLQIDNSPLQNEPILAPKDKSYLEINLPDSLQEAITEYLRGEKEQVLYLDCLSDALYGAINGNLWGGRISEEQAVYLREKYLYAPKEDAEHAD